MSWRDRVRECKRKCEAEKKEEQKIEEKPLKIEEKVELQAVDSNSNLYGSNFELLKKEDPVIVREKGAIMIQMIELFGDNKSKEYFKFIQENFSQGKEKIIQLWLDQRSK